EYSTVVGGADSRLNSIVLPNIIANTVTKQIIDVAVLFEQTIAIKVNIDAKAILNNKTITNSSKNFPISICIFPNRGIPIQAVTKSNNKTQNTDIIDTIIKFDKYIFILLCPITILFLSVPLEYSFPKYTLAKIAIANPIS